MAVFHHSAIRAIRRRTVIEEEERPFVEYTKPMIPICPVVSFTYGKYEFVIGIEIPFLEQLHRQSLPSVSVMTVNLMG